MNALLFLAATAAPVSGQSDGWLTPYGISHILTALGAFALILLGNKLRHVKLAPGSELTTNEQPPSRREFEKLEAVVAASNALHSERMDQAFERAMLAISSSAERADKRITNQNDRLNRKIEEVASGCYQGRQKIWVVTNQNAERIARLEERSDITEQLSRLVENLSSSFTPKVIPTHPHTNA